MEWYWYIRNKKRIELGIEALVSQKPGKEKISKGGKRQKVLNEQ